MCCQVPYKDFLLDKIRNKITLLLTINTSHKAMLTKTEKL